MFWAAFDLILAVVPLKVALGLEKFDFWALLDGYDPDVLYLTIRLTMITYRHRLTMGG